MQIVFGSVLVLVGSVLIGLAYHDKVADAWKVLMQ